MGKRKINSSYNPKERKAKQVTRMALSKSKSRTSKTSQKKKDMEDLFLSKLIEDSII